MRGKTKKIIALFIAIAMILSPLNLNIAFATDYSVPTIDNVNASSDEVTYGSSVTISTKVTDIYDISSVQLILETPHGEDENHNMTYNAQTGKYQCTIKFNELKYLGCNYYSIKATNINGYSSTHQHDYCDSVCVNDYKAFDSKGYGTIVTDSFFLYDDLTFKVSEKSRQINVNIQALCDSTNSIGIYKETSYSYKKMHSGSFTNNFSKTYTLSKGTYQIVIDNSSYYDVPYKLSILDVTKYPQSGKLVSSVSLKTGKSKTLTLTNIYPSNANCNYINWSTSNSKILKIKGNGQKCSVTAKKAGTAYVYAKLKNGKTYKTKVKVTNPPPKLKYKSRSLYKGDRCKVNLLYTKGKVTYKSSNKKIATVSSKGTIKAKSLGKCTIYAKNKGKTYKLKISVVRQHPDFGAFLYDYDTRNNVFTVKFKNKSNKTLTINSGTFKVEDIDYKSFDRKIKLKKTYKIKPNKTKYIRFKVIGRTTWYDYRDFTLHYKFTFDGKKYIGHVWNEDSVYKCGKYWYATYNDENWYKSWYY